MNKTFYTSDWHLGHANILKYNRFSRKGSTVDEMSELLVSGIIAQCPRGSDLYNLGDLSFYPAHRTEHFLDRIQAAGIRHHMILGNHDRQLVDHLGLNRFFESVTQMQTIKIAGKVMVLSHFPQLVWDRGHYGALHLHGHRHSMYQTPDQLRRLDVGVDTRSAGDMLAYSHEEVLNILTESKNLNHH